MNKIKTVYDKVVNSKITLILNAAFGVFGSMLYFSMHTMLGFIGYFTFVALPYILGALSIVCTILSLILLFYKNNKVCLTVTLILNSLILILSIGYFFGLYNMIKTFLLEFAKILIIYLFFAAIVYLCFFHGKLQYKGKQAVAVTLCAVIVAGSVLCFTDFDALRINYIACDPVVYAVDTDYQIVWTTAARSTGAVTVGEKTYYDEYAGQIRTNTKVHKVTVPQSALDEKKEYTVLSKAILSEQGFSGLLGYTVKKTLSFRPVDPSDGIQSYVLTDTHDFNNAAVKAAKYADNLDFLVLGGDHLNFIDDPEHFTRILSLAHSITKGSKPVVFARGNHELKCPDSEFLDRYVGAEEGKFYYTFRLQNVWGVVLDMGEDHADDWKEFYGTAAYDGYRNDQIDFLDKIIENKNNEYAADGIDYRIGICHIAPSFTEYDRPYMFDTLVKINERLNEINLDVMLSGHLHKVYAVEEGYQVGAPLFYRAEYAGKANSTPDFLATGANYKTIICGRHAASFDCKAPDKFSKYIGTALNFDNEGKNIRFTNEKKETLYTVSPFENIEYGKAVEL